MDVAGHFAEAADGQRLHVLERGADGGLAVMEHTRHDPRERS